ncbi:cytochrome c-type biogenesis protein CcmH/NrfF [Catenuloplanes nepalensis]|uniref:Cytochrome c-type biogenesis protein CcmH/NrfF n=1 Tax=Catenuloplanes nepalensis TaxID=587533 RepID=A0ABT9MLI7_9ACTN|nr:hypothetical protein [Catenuloplanes nepalensis]MDP9792268.1 cytochrome c-type biogenesis protein CcmH/NrfF [Catenuloplanes nepalensis]
MPTLILWVSTIALLAVAGLAWLAARPRTGRVPVVRVIDRDGRVRSLPADDPRISRHL